MTTSHASRRAANASRRRRRASRASARASSSSASLSYARAYVSDAVDVDARETSTTRSRAAFASSSSFTSSRRRLGRRRGTNAPASSEFPTAAVDARARGDDDARRANARTRSTRGGVEKRRDDDIEDAVARGEARGEAWDCLFFARRRLRGGDADGNARGVKLTVEGVITD